MASNKTNTKVVYREKRTKKKYHRRAKPQVHLVPDLLYLTAAAEPLVVPINGYSSVASQVKYSVQNGGEYAEYIPGNIVTGVKETWANMAILAGLGYAASWFGKKTRLGKLGTKEVKLF